MSSGSTPNSSPTSTAIAPWRLNQQVCVISKQGVRIQNNPVQIQRRGELFQVPLVILTAMKDRLSRIPTCRHVAFRTGKPDSPRTRHEEMQSHCAHPRQNHFYFLGLTLTASALLVHFDCPLTAGSARKRMRVRNWTFLVVHWTFTPENGLPKEETMPQRSQRGERRRGHHSLGGQLVGAGIGILGIS